MLWSATEVRLSKLHLLTQVIVFISRACDNILQISSRLSSSSRGITNLCDYLFLRILPFHAVSGVRPASVIQSTPYDPQYACPFHHNNSAQSRNQCYLAFNGVTKTHVATTRCAGKFCAPETCLGGSLQILSWTPVVMSDVCRSFIHPPPPPKKNAWQLHYHLM